MNKKKKISLGRSLINDRFKNKGHRKVNDSFLHYAELNDGYDWARLNPQSVTEQDSFQEFLVTAQLADKEFKAEKLNIKIVNPKIGGDLLSKEEYKLFEKNKAEKRDLLKIPRRPKWDTNTTKEELNRMENDSFIDWKRDLAKLGEEEGILLTPYEKNIHFWRQLWRVLERSDVIVQILDARNPLLFRCEDLEKYVKELESEKINLLLLNKSDLLTDRQREVWAEYFDNIGVKVVFFSAKDAALEELKEEEDDDNKTKAKEKNLDDTSESTDDENLLECGENKSISWSNSEEENLHEGVARDNLNPNKDESIDPKNSIEETLKKLHLGHNGCNSSKMLGRTELFDYFRTFKHHVNNVKSSENMMIGLVGYPNVGKSSTINALLGSKKVSVSATPGKTKHFQTWHVDNYFVLCDCPGLVMPSFVSTKAEMVLNGILPIDQMRDHVSPTTLLASLIPRYVIEAEYGIMIPKPPEGEDPDRPPTSEELLSTYAYCRGFMTQNGQPDNPRASRYILKDYVTGRLLYCIAPPGVPQEKFHVFKKKDRKPVKLTLKAERAIRVTKMSSDDFDKKMFSKPNVHLKGIPKIGPEDVMPNIASDGKKPWKNHKEKRNKKQKLRRVYRHLDE